MATTGERMDRKQYEKALRALQVELCALQDWVKAEGARVIVVLEGRDAAGKGGLIKAITDRVSPRVFRVVALPAPTEREQSQVYMQRYIRHSPAAGEVVIFDVLGRLLLCEATDAELAALYPEQALPHVGIGSPPTLAELKQVLHEDLARGYTVGDLFLEQGVAGIAAPVRAPDGEFVAVVGLAVEKAALKPGVFRDWLVKEVLAAAAEIADRLSRRHRPGQGVGAARTAPYEAAAGHLMQSI